MVRYERVVIVGVGLLGGSLGKALLSRGLTEHVIGVGRHREQLDSALAAGTITEATTDLALACESANVIVICTPVQHIVQYLNSVLKAMPHGAWVTDVGSTKVTICENLPARAHHVFCGSHPLAGSDKSGAVHADAQLFDGRLTIVTPTNTTPSPLVDTVTNFWQGVGSRTLLMTPQEHDQAVARTSHLPHAVAAALAGITPDALLPLAASGWCDTTRVAAGNVEMWRQIMCENRQPLLAALRDYSRALGYWIQALEQGDDQRLNQLLQLGKQQRDSVGN